MRNVSKNEAVQETEAKEDQVNGLSEEAKEVDEIEDVEDKETELSGKASSSQQRYIEELERLLREEKIKRIKAEEKLERLTSKKSSRHVRILE